LALNINTVWEIQTGGDDTNGGAFVTGSSGTDFSQQTSPQATLTTASVVHSTTTQINVSAGDYTVSAADVGNQFQLNSGTATAGFYQITAVDVPNNRWTVERSVGTAGQTCAGKMGGCLASLGKTGRTEALGTSAGQGNKVWVKSGTYTLTSTSDNVSGGLLNVQGFATGLVIEGYQTTRGDRAARPVISAGALTGIANAVVRGNASRSGEIVNLEYDANNGTGNVGGFGSGMLCNRCVVRNASVANAVAFATPAIRSAAINCRSGFSVLAIYCMADTCVTGYTTSSVAIGCIAKACTTAYALSAARTVNCIAYGGTTGFNYDASTGGTALAVNCIAYGNSGRGFFSSGGTNGLIAIGCAVGNNSVSNFTSCLEEGSITLSADPFTNAAGGDFSPNNVAGGGALLRAAGLRFGDGLTYDQVNYSDVGVFQHQDAAIAAQLRQFGRGHPY
jgi:hypothetical protein